MGKLKRVKRPAKKSTQAPARGVVIRETPEILVSKKNEKVDVARGKGIKLLRESSKSETKSWGNDEDDNNNDQDSERIKKNPMMKTKHNQITKMKGDEYEEMDYTTSLLYDDVDIRLNKPVDTDKGFVQEESTDAAMTNIQQGNENPEILQVIEDAHVTLSTVPQKTKVPVTNFSHSSDLEAKFLNFADIPHSDAEIVSPLDVHVHHEVPSQQTPTLLTEPVSVIIDSSPVFSTIILQSLPSFTHPPQQSSPTPPPTTKAKNASSILPNFALILPEEVSNFASLVIQRMLTESLEQAVLAKDSSQPQSSYEAATTLTEFELKKTFIDKMDKSESYLRRRKDKDKDEDPFAGSDRGLKKRKTSKDTKPPKGPRAKESQSSSSKGNKSKSKSSGKSVQLEEPEFEVTDSDMPHNHEENHVIMMKNPKKRLHLNVTGSPNLHNLNNLLILIGMVARLHNKDKIKAGSFRKLDWENPEGGDYPFDLTKPLPLVKIRNRQKVPVDYFFNNDLKYLQGGISTMTYTTSLTKTKAAQYDLLGIEDMVLKIWSLVKVAYDKHALWGNSHWREQRKTFYAYTRGLQSRHDVYSTKRILEVTEFNVIKKHGYGYLQNWRDLATDILIDSVVVLRYEKRSKSKNKGIVPTEMELVLEQTQQVGNHVKEILLKLNLPDHRSILTDLKEDHEVHLKLVLELLKKEKLFVKISKYEFWLQEVHFLGHMVNNNDIYMESSKIEAMKN
uniref:Putative reverse transcriptase domain-containing protein n=1 Tax=Tanacetum cinerariifolium TaxID=118510 RepID=A0A6L2NB07_TANCI|nr:putative reverse transcriptase domain-containing protein [Tanacetum cinerariifolium]